MTGNKTKSIGRAVGSNPPSIANKLAIQADMTAKIKSDSPIFNTVLRCMFVDTVKKPSITGRPSIIPVGNKTPCSKAR